MADKRPFFLTGANAKIKVNGVTLAFATNLSYSVRVEHATPTVLGMYEPSSIEPLSYAVTGQFTVIRYVADVADKIKGISGTSELGNGIGAWGKKGNLSNPVKRIFDPTDGRAYESFDPSKLEVASRFSIEVFQKTDGGTQSVSRIRDVRITQSDFNIGQKSAATQTFNFAALYVDEDSFLADFSGSGQQFS
jgi:hypothetical protein